MIVSITIFFCACGGAAAAEKVPQSNSAGKAMSLVMSFHNNILSFLQEFITAEKTFEGSSCEEVTAPAIKAAAEGYIRHIFPHAELDEFSPGTPENSSWGPTWPKVFRKGIPLEVIMTDYLEDALEFYGQTFWIDAMESPPGGSIFVREDDRYYKVWWIS